MEENWCYRGEGNASIVAASLKENIVYRIRKAENDETDKTLQIIPIKSPFIGIGFVENVMKDFISPQFLAPMKAVKVPDGLIEVIETSWRKLRPGFRLCKSVSCETMEATEMPDLCFLSCCNADESVKPTYSFEIKPKWGLLPVTGSVADVKRSNCRFCMHQFLKLKQGKWTKKSSYCPIDLFSGCHTRMKSALHNLYTCPQNNFCIFKNGQRIWGNQTAEERESSDCGESSRMRDKLMDELLDVVMQCLLYPATDSVSKGISLNQRQQCSSSSCGHVCDQSCSSLPLGSLLSDLLRVQSLDDLDNESLCAHFRNVSDAFSTDPELRNSSSIDGPFTCGWLEAPPGDSLSTNVSFSIYKMKQFLVARSAKDCSIFISVQEADSNVALQEPLPARTFSVTSALGVKHLCCISVIDLDPKSFNKVPRYIDEEKSVVDCFLKSS